MRYLLVLLVPFFLSSCSGTTRPAESSRISLETTDISRQEFFLMSVRETGIMISPYSTDYFHIDGAIASSFSVPFEKIRFLEEAPPSDLAQAALAAGAGLLGGAYLGNLFRPLTDEEIQSGVPEFRFAKETYIGMAAGTALGLGVWYFFIHKTPKTYHVERREDRVALRRIAIYHDEEPAELARIR